MKIESQKSRGKEVFPDETIAFIENLLDKADIKIEYEPGKSSLSECKSSRVSVSDVSGKFIGTNGKGLGDGFCKASAYGELMERLQNKAFFFTPTATDPCVKEFHEISGKPLYHVHDSEQPECVQYIKKKIASTVKPPVAFVSPEMMADGLLDNFSIDALGNAFVTDSYYCVGKDEFVNLPTDLIVPFAGSNGMAAGNSLEEAIVQAMSEIMERYASRAYINGEYIPPEIPKEYLKKYPEICSIISKIEESGSYRAIISDCSMGRKIPVVCGTVIDTKNNTLGIKFGAHPDMEIALERVFTEAMQGLTLEQFAGSNPLIYTTKDNSEVNTFNFMKVGLARCLPSVLLQHPSYEFVPWEDVSVLDNRELARRMVKLAEEMGGDVYISNHSFLGFPTVFIYIPGISELQTIDSLKLKELLAQRDGHDYFRHLNDLSDEQVKELIRIARIKRNAVMENTIPYMSDIPVLPDGRIVPQNAPFFEGVCLYRLGGVELAAVAFERFLENYKYCEGEETYSYASCVMQYVKAQAAGVAHKDIEDIIRAMYPKKIVEKVLYDFEDPMQVLSRVYPLCNGRTCDECDNVNCCYPQIVKLYKKLVTIEAQNPPDINELRAIFKDNDEK